jgi:osmotically-inducible protein OsmY
VQVPEGQVQARVENGWVILDGQAEIEETIKREAGVDARHIRVEVSNHTAKLYGHVHSLHEASAARAAAAAPGVATVGSHLVVSRRQSRPRR